MEVYVKGSEIGKPPKVRSIRPILRKQYSDDLRERRAFIVRSAPIPVPGPL